MNVTASFTRGLRSYTVKFVSEGMTVTGDVTFDTVFNEVERLSL